ncbi:MAG: serine/threonine-protein phosphatase [Ignavibacteriales bacterium]|nr:serine/threonine-protein phosphatase [Ignavibacteriales bacterium]
MRKLYIDSAYRTDIGLKRELNEDYCFSASDKSGMKNGVVGVLTVSDGMGGHDAGDIASKMTCEYLEHLFVRGGCANLAHEMGVDANEYPALMNEVFARMNKRIVERAKSFDLLRTMGCTCVVGLISYEAETGSSVLLVGWVGDSRCYIVRDNEIFLATEDDSYVWDLYKKGRITYQDMRVHPKKNVLTQALGTVETVSPRFNRIRLQPDDIVLLCSDGLHGSLPDQEIKAILKSSPDAESASQRLIDVANEAGGKDNISVAVAYCRSGRASTGRPSKSFAALGKLAVASVAFGLLAVGSLLIVEPFQKAHSDVPILPRVKFLDVPGFSRIAESVPITFTLEPYDAIGNDRGGYRLVLTSNRGVSDTIALSELRERNRNLFVFPHTVREAKTQKLRLTLMKEKSALSSDATLLIFKGAEAKSPTPPLAASEDRPLEEHPMFRLSKGIDGKIQVWVVKDFDVEGNLDIEISSSAESDLMTVTRKNRILPKASNINYVPGERVTVRVVGTQRSWTQTLS